MDGKRLYLDSAAGKKQSADSVPQERISSDRYLGLHYSQLLRHCRHEQRRQPDRRSGRLAILPSALVGIALGIFAYVVGRVDYAAYLNFPYVPGAVKSSWWEAR